MPGISSVIQIAKHAAKSSATKSAAKKAVSSSIVKSAVSTIVLDAAVPIIKDRISQRFEKEDIETTTNINGLDGWKDPSTLGLQDETYSRYLQSQLLLLSEYEHYLESFEDDEFQSYMNQFYSFCDELETQEKAAEFLISSLESYINHLEQFAVRDDEFRSYAVQGPVDIRSQNSVASPSDDRIQSLNDLEDYINACDRHIEYLQEYMNEDVAYKIHVESADDLLSGSVADMENAVLAGVSYLDYLEQYAGKNTHYNQYVEGFSVGGESYYSLVAAENELIKDLSA